MRTKPTTRKPKSAKRGPPTKDLPDIYPWPLDPTEWDFRNIPPEEVKVATYYEYACSCDWIRLLWKAWLTKPFPAWKVLRLAPDVEVLDWDYHNAQPVSAILSKHYRNGIPRFASKGYTAISDHLVSSAPLALRQHEFEDILFAVPAFPTPWLALDEASKKRLKERFALPYWKDPAFSVFDSSEPIDAYRQNSSYENRIFEVVLDWNRREEDIVADFKVWLAAQYKKFGHPPKGQQGMANSDKYERLRWLTAWRLHRAGRDHGDAQKILSAQASKPSKYPDHDLPLCPDEGSWRNFHTKARKVCQKLFPLPVW